MAFFVVEISVVGAVWLHVLWLAWQESLSHYTLTFFDFVPLLKGRSRSFNVAVIYLAFQLIQSFFLHSYLPHALLVLLRCVVCIVLCLAISGIPLVYTYYLIGTRLPSSEVVLHTYNILDMTPRLLQMGCTMGTLYVAHWLYTSFSPDGDGGLYLNAGGYLEKTLAYIGGALVLMWTLRLPK